MLKILAKCICQYETKYYTKFLLINQDAICGSMEYNGGPIELLALIFTLTSCPNCGIWFVPLTLSLRYFQKDNPNFLEVFLRLINVSRH